MLAVYNSIAFTTASGVAVAPNANIEVRNEDDNALSNIFQDEDGEDVQAQGGSLFQADAEGFFTFYVAGRLRGFKITVTSGVESRTLRNVAIGTAGQVDTTALGASLLAADDEPAAAAVLSSPVIEIDSGTVLGSEHWGATLRATVDDTQLFEDCSTLGDGWWAIIEIDTGVSLTFSPNSPDSIDGESEITVVGPTRLHVSCDGLNLRTDRGYGLRLIKRTIYTSGSGTHVYDKRTRARRAQVQAAGGGGGGADGQGAGTGGQAGGGGAGGYVDDLEMDVPSNIGASEAYSIGAFGTGGAAGNNAGTSAGNTTLGGLTAGGGTAGNGVTASSGSIQAVSGDGGTAAGGDLNIPGGRAIPSRVISGTTTVVGKGGDSFLGRGGCASQSAGDGPAGTGYGSGGGGAVAITDTTNRAGGNGAPGVIIIEEFA